MPSIEIVDEPPKRRPPPPPPRPNHGLLPVLRNPVQTAVLGNCYYDSLAVALLAQLPKDANNSNRTLALKQFGAIHAFLKTSPASSLKTLAERFSTADDFLVALLKTVAWKVGLTTALRLYLADAMSKKLSLTLLADPQDDATVTEFYAQLESEFTEFKKNKDSYQDETKASQYSFSKVSAIQTFFAANLSAQSDAIVAAFKAASNQEGMVQDYIKRISTDRVWADPVVQDLVRVALGDGNYAINPEGSSSACVQLKHDACHFSPLLAQAELDALNTLISENKLSFVTATNTAVVTTGLFKSVAEFMKTSNWLQTYTPKDLNKTAAKEKPTNAECANKTITITYVEKNDQHPAEAVSLTLEEDAQTKKISLKAEHSKDEKTLLEKQYQRIADSLFSTAIQLTQAQDGRYRFDIDSVNHEEELELIAKSLYDAGFEEVFHKGEKLENKVVVAEVGVQPDKPASEPKPAEPAEPAEPVEPAPSIALSASPQGLDPAAAEVSEVLTSLVDQVVQQEEAEQVVGAVMEAVMQRVHTHVEQAQRQAEQVVAANNAEAATLRNVLPTVEKSSNFALPYVINYSFRTVVDFSSKAALGAYALYTAGQYILTVVAGLEKTQTPAWVGNKTQKANVSSVVIEELNPDANTSIFSTPDPAVVAGTSEGDATIFPEPPLYVASSSITNATGSVSTDAPKENLSLSEGLTRALCFGAQCFSPPECFANLLSLDICYASASLLAPAETFPPLSPAFPAGLALGFEDCGVQELVQSVLQSSARTAAYPSIFSTTLEPKISEQEQMRQRMLHKS